MLVQKTGGDPWRGKFAPFAETATSTERTAGIANTKAEGKSYEDTFTFDRSSFNDGDLVLRQRHYRIHMAKWEGMDGPTADKDFLKKLEVQGDEWVTAAGSPRIRTTNPEGHINNENGTENRKGARQSAGITDEHYNVKHRKLMKVLSHDGDGSDLERETFGRHQVPERRSSVGGSDKCPVTEAPPSTRFLSATTLGHASEVGETGRDVASVSLVDGVPYKKAAPPQLNAAALEALQDGSKLEWATMCGVEVVRRKRDMQAVIDQFIDKFSGKKGLIQSVKEAVEKFDARADDVDRADLPFSPTTLLEDLGSKRDAARDFLQAVRATTKDQMAGKCAEWKNLEAIMEALEDNGIELLNTLTEKDKQLGVQARKSYMTERWLLTKIIQLLILGACPKLLAKHLGAIIAAFLKAKSPEYTEDQQFWKYSATTLQFNVDESKFVNTIVGLWTENNPMVKNLTEHLRGPMKQIIEDKMTSVYASMEAHPSWTGSMGVIRQWESTRDVLKPLFQDGWTDDDKGNFPWMDGFKTNHMREGPTGTPCPGPAALYTSCHNDFWIAVLSASEVISQGLTLDTVNRFLDTAGGVNTFKANGFVIKVQKGDVLYVPSGSLVYLWDYEQLEGRNKVNSFRNVLHFPLGQGFSWYPNEHIGQAFNVWNQLTFKVKEGSMWTDRANWFAKYSKTP
jgi:hypothetical protein